MKTTVISVLGTQKDAHGGTGPSRWDTWRPTIGLVQQDDLPIDELHLIFNRAHLNLAERIREDIGPNLDYELERFSDSSSALRSTGDSTRRPRRRRHWRD